ncbi:isoprenylcysteine carboxylmethyltransferase family protein [bacterium]|nr:isoprenylcysteine carboxylmethyltransferase family protein [bacterium]MBU1065322.1 isoprenylcysteine carboxylmethyltransferase family protein [bacterium]MBU1633754.1 isoprenylcysteine carboxylmethyltransferase family protein [bacterium]MBU1873022.1 isoprenylcysteine carboxylmethyltransferase family protein [bacterium]
MTLRNFFFRYRGITPLPFVLILLVQSDLTRVGVICGLLVVALGESIRLAGVRRAGGNTRTRKVGAKKLITAGIFSYVRNPLYLGNVIIYIGFALMAGGPWVVYLMIIALVYFIVQYGFIIALEETKLKELFGDEYRDYTNNVPRLLPRLTSWQKDPDNIPRKWRKVLRAEKSTLLNQAVFTLVLFIKEIVINNPNGF